MNLSSTIAVGKWMKSRLWTLGALPVVLAAGCSDGSIGPTETRDDSFTVGESPILVVTGTNGRIIVMPGADGLIRVQATLKRPDDIAYETTQEGDRIIVEAKEKGSRFLNFGQSPEAEIEITAPPSTRVELRTSNGGIELTGMRGSGKASTSNGKIDMEDVSGEFEVSTSNGKVTIAQATGAFQVKTSNGRIDFDGELAAGGDNRMTTSNGSVEIKLQGTPSVKLDASTSNGSISTSLPVLTTSLGDENHIEGTIGSGEAELFVSTSNGSVTIR